MHRRKSCLLLYEVISAQKVCTQNARPNFWQSARKSGVLFGGF